MTGPEFDDALADACALVAAVRLGETGDIAVILRHCNSYGVAVTLAKLFSVVMNEHDVPPDSFRKWAGKAIAQP